MPNFLSNLKELRISQHLTQKQLADKLGVSQNAVYMWENGLREPAFGMVEKIAEILGVPVHEIMSWKEFDKYTMGKEADANSQTVEKLAQNIAKFHGGKAKLNDAYDKLNTVGQNKAVEQVEMLTKIPEYQKKPEE